eukprot:COSAG02_NODE_4060_length_5844_cov_11.464578_1_plen_71_part_10
MTLGVGSLLVIYSYMNCVFLAFIIRLLTPSIPAGLRLIWGLDLGVQRPIGTQLTSLHHDTVSSTVAAGRRP